MKMNMRKIEWQTDVSHVNGKSNIPCILFALLSNILCRMMTTSIESNESKRKAAALAFNRFHSAKKEEKRQFIFAVETVYLLRLILQMHSSLQLYFVDAAFMPKKRKKKKKRCCTYSKCAIERLEIFSAHILHADNFNWCLLHIIVLLGIRRKREQKESEKYRKKEQSKREDCEWMNESMNGSNGSMNFPFSIRNFLFLFHFFSFLFSTIFSSGSRHFFLLLFLNFESRSMQR